jgi:hypothetical protein
MTGGEMAELFARLLETDIEPEDNFFDMGGTSVLALRLLAEIERTWGTALDLIDVVEHPTPELLAAYAARAGEQADSTGGAR